MPTNLNINTEELKSYLDSHVEKFNTPDFIKNDPISIPHQFSRLQDIEIMAFWVSMLAWGKRATIIKKANELVELMDGAPYDFILNHEEKDRRAFLPFKHRTFQPTDTLYFLAFFQDFYKKNQTLEDAFAKHISPNSENIEAAFKGFHNQFFSLPDAPQRTRKHVSTPARNSACKRLNMFLRWMVRQDDKGVDFGLWKKIKPAQLLIPLDVHVDRVARQFGLLQRKQTDWKSVIELTNNLKQLDANDPVKYDFALFGIGVGL
ncbi:MAG TPA: TIGR02757 family protein [Phaeodactylibacter sp.]|nr:TIGR02757 family protein [Phaeodactylibacter sp.]